MIDFRYHVVSLVAVLIALAVGIILGAGPLRGQLSDTLEGQVAELGAERNDLRSQVELHERRAEAKDGLIEQLGGPASSGLLPETRIAVVQLPEAQDNYADQLATMLASSGGQVVGRIEILPGWEEADDGMERAEVVTQVAASLDVPNESAAVLATVLTGVTPSGAPVQVESALDTLQEADLISVRRPEDASEAALPGSGDAGHPDAVVLLDGGLSASPADVTARAGVVRSRLELVAAMGETLVPVVVLGTGTETWQDPEEAAEDPLVSAVRADGTLVRTVSTVDNAESASGTLAATWALVRQLSGEVGHYGLAADAGALAPPPPSAPEVSPGGDRQLDLDLDPLTPPSRATTPAPQP